MPFVLNYYLLRPTKIIALRFTLTYNYTTSVVTYVPKIDPKRDEKLLKNLPDYLTDEIEFNRELESKFFWRILNFNNDDDA